MNPKKILFLRLCAHLFQLVLMISLFILEYLATRKAGVMRHLYHRKMEYMTTFASDFMVSIYIIIIMVIVFVLFFLFKKLDIFEKEDCKVEYRITFLLNGFAVLFMSLDYFKMKYTYAYGIIFINFSLVLQYMMLLLVSKDWD